MTGQCPEIGQYSLSRDISFPCATNCHTREERIILLTPEFSETTREPFSFCFIAVPDSGGSQALKESIRPPPLSLWPHLLVGGDSPFFIEAVDGVGAGVIARHPRRAGRHAGHPETGGLGFFLQEFENHVTRNMALDDVLADRAGVARIQAWGNPEPALEGVELFVGNIVRLDFKAL